MLMSHTKQFLYFKTIKTAGTSIEMYFEPYCTEYYSNPMDYPVTHGARESISHFDVVGFRGAKIPNGTVYYNHMSAECVKQNVRKADWKSYYKFCCIRNPYDKAVSGFFHHLQSEPKAKKFVSDASINQIRPIFREWLTREFFSFYDRATYTIDNEVIVNDVIYYENLQNDVKKINERLGLPQREMDLNIKAHHRFRPEHWSQYYDEKTAEIIQRIFDKEFTYFGYDRHAWRGV